MSMLVLPAGPTGQEFHFGGGLVLLMSARFIMPHKNLPCGEHFHKCSSFQQRNPSLHLTR